MSRLLLLLVAAGILLSCVVAAEPQPVDNNWQRSDGAPVETETRTDVPPEFAAKTASGTAIPLYLAAGVCGVFALCAAGMWLWRWKR